MARWLRQDMERMSFTLLLDSGREVTWRNCWEHGWHQVAAGEQCPGCAAERNEPEDERR